MRLRSQINDVATRVEASLEGLAPGRHALAVHTYGEHWVRQLSRTTRKPAKSPMSVRGPHERRRKHGWRAWSRWRPERGLHHDAGGRRERACGAFERGARQQDSGARIYALRNSKACSVQRCNLTLSVPVQVWDIIGRALVVYEHAEPGIAGKNVAAVIARSAAAGDNTKKICACDGTLIWEAGDLISRPTRRAAASGLR